MTAAQQTAAPPSRGRWPFSPGATIGSVLAANRGLGPGFDYVRLGLALLIFNAHAGAITNGRPEDNLLIVGNAAARSVHHWSSWREPIYTALVPAFFAVSGFLVTSSAFRTRNVRTFLAFRLLRIFPALTVEVTLSALVLGPVFTALPLREYFTNEHFFRYFGNIAGFVTFVLPGVFLANPVPGIVNNNLWTLPPEFWCYLLLAGLMIVTLVYSRAVYSVLFVVATVFMLPWAFLHEYGMSRGNLELPVIVYYFFAGCFLYHWRDRIPLNAVLYLVAGVAAYALFYLPHMVMIAPLFLSYFIVAVGMTRWPHLPLVKRGDYSYGIYLYGFPLTQALAASLPWLTRETLLFRLSAFVLTAAFAVFSWHCLEKPALRFKTLLVAAPKLPPKHLSGVPGQPGPVV